MILFLWEQLGSLHQLLEGLMVLNKSGKIIFNIKAALKVFVSIQVLFKQDSALPLRSVITQ